jgi:two-component system sensor histidine kinase CpxA
MNLSLPGKILLTAVLNVALLAGGFLTFLQMQSRGDFGSILLAPARDRILSIARLVALEAGGTGGDQAAREEVLARYARLYGVDLYLFTNDGEQSAGERITLPAAVLERLQGPQARLARRVDEPLSPPAKKKGPPPRQEHPIFVEVSSAPLRYWVGARVPVPYGGGSARGALLISTSSLLASNLLFDFKPLLAGVALAGLVTVLCWLPLIRGLTRSLSQVTEAAGRIAEGRFDIHVEQTRTDELGRLGAAINRMAGQLESFVKGQKRFLGDIAHELSAPVARMQLATGILEQQAPESLRPSVEDLREEMQEMSALVHELLSFSKAGMAVQEAPPVQVNVREIVEQAALREAPDTSRVDIQVDAGLTALARPQHLERAMANLIRNGIRYGGEAAPVRVTAERVAGEVVLTVSDAGPGVPEAELENIFTPFYRLDQARTRESGGAGLGLAIVTSSVEACGGTVSARNLRPTGFAVSVRLKSY